MDNNTQSPNPVNTANPSDPSIIRRNLEGIQITAEMIKEKQSKTIECIAEKRASEVLFNIYELVNNTEIYPIKAFHYAQKEDIISEKVAEILKKKGFKIDGLEVSW